VNENGKVSPLKLKAPLEQIEWRDPQNLRSNEYNPNIVVSKEMELLKLSLLQQGWIQPILITPDGLIIDGFHRTTIARMENWLVPCAILDLPEVDRIMLTVRINRAKGTHVALRMSDLVQRLLALGCTEAHIAEQIGGTEKEIEILKKGDIFKSLDLTNWKYSQAWLPKAYTPASAK